jgi:hypothetical protein
MNGRVDEAAVDDAGLEAGVDGSRTEQAAATISVAAMTLAARPTWNRC